MTRCAVLDISAAGVRYVVTTPTPHRWFDVVDRAEVALPLGRTPREMQPRARITRQEHVELTAGVPD